MYVTENVEIPDKLIQAQREGRLVVFAGAGVSMGAPSNLPSFRCLAEKVGQGVMQLELNGPIDSYLGRLEDRGVHIRDRVKQVLTPANSRHTPLHEGLLKLSKSPNEVRVITTNFDSHFSVAVESLWKAKLPHFFAPALPLGDDFRGLVYLHGSLTRDLKDLVLTDRDFGKAYLVRAWATRFLVNVFQTYEVLFAGYSHDDPVMNYLARALPPRTERYALVPSDEDAAAWQNRGVVPITYDADNDHQELTSAIESWAKLVHTGILDHKAKIQSIVQGSFVGGELSPVDQSYLSDKLSAPATTQYFVEIADGLDWLAWVANHESFKALFDVSCTPSESTSLLCDWFTRKYVREHHKSAIAVMCQHGQTMHPVVVDRILRHLTFANPAPSVEVLSSWIPLLLQQSNLHSRILGTLLERLPPDSQSSKLLLLEYLTRPKVHVSHQASTPPKMDVSGTTNISVEIRFAGDGYQLKKQLQKTIIALIPSRWSTLERILTNHVERAHMLLASYSQASREYDLLSRFRPTIERHDEDNHQRSVLDFAVDSLRETIDWLAINEPGHAQNLISRWKLSDAPLLRRLAVYGLGKLPNISPEQILQEVLDQNWQFDFSVKHEVFGISQTAFRRAKSKSCRRFIEALANGPDGRLKTDEDYCEIYNWMVWLERARSDCRALSMVKRNILRLHPEFRPRDEPDSTRVFWTGWADDRVIPLEDDALVAKTMKDAVAFVLDWKSQSTPGLERQQTATEKLGELTTKNCEWSLRFAAELARQEEWEARLWSPLINGWRKAKVAGDAANAVCRVLLEHAEMASIATPVSSFLDDLAKDSEKNEFGLFRDAAEALAQRIFEALDQDVDSSDIADAEHGWLNVAINRPGGDLALFWIRSLASLTEVTGDDTTARFPDRYRTVFEQFVRSNSAVGVFGRIVLVSQIHYFSALDLEWTASNLVPLLQWEKDQDEAARCWDGFLIWGYSPENLLPRLLPEFRKAFKLLKSKDRNASDALAGHLAGIALYSSINPLLDGWLQEFIDTERPEDHKQFASTLAIELMRLDDNAQLDTWNRWLREYLEMRLHGIPRKLADEEFESVVDWTFGLTPVLESFIPLICQREATVLDSHFFHDLKESELLVSHKNAIGNLLMHLMKADYKESWILDEIMESIQRLKNSGINHELLRSLAERLLELGYSGASDLL